MHMHRQTDSEQLAMKTNCEMSDYEVLMSDVAFKCRLDCTEVCLPDN
ncbi:hypothetical protein CDAR_64211, partial [Caerostris darwini]